MNELFRHIRTGYFYIVRRKHRGLTVFIQLSPADKLGNPYYFMQAGKKSIQEWLLDGVL
jgi:hypothetical protein